MTIGSKYVSLIQFLKQENFPTVSLSVVQQAMIDALNVRLSYLNIVDLSVLYPAPTNTSLLPKRLVTTLQTGISSKLLGYGSVSLVDFDTISSSEVYEVDSIIFYTLSTVGGPFCTYENSIDKIIGWKTTLRSNSGQVMVLPTIYKLNTLGTNQKIYSNTIQIPLNEKITQVKFTGYNSGISRIIITTSSGLQLSTVGSRTTYCPGGFDVSVSTAGMNVIGFSAGFNVDAGLGFCVSNMGIQVQA